MGLGDALSTKAEHEHIFMERQREYWYVVLQRTYTCVEYTHTHTHTLTLSSTHTHTLTHNCREYDNYPQGEISEMIDLYVERGMTKEDATTVVELMAPHRSFFVDVMMVEELGLHVPSVDANPWFDGLITFLSFTFFGFFPLVPFVVAQISGDALGATIHDLFVASAVATALTLFALGAVSSMYSTKSVWRNGFEMVLVGGVVSTIAFSIASIAANGMGAEL